MKAAPGGDRSEPWSRLVVEIQPDRIKMIGAANQSLEFDTSLNFIDPKGAEYSPLTLKFPMSVGMEWKYSARAGPTWQGERSGAYKVAAHEAVTVPAGTFDCFRVEGEWQSNFMNFKGRGSEKIWYCPKINFVAKRSSESIAEPQHGTRTTEARLSELTQFKPGP